MKKKIHLSNPTFGILFWQCTRDLSGWLVLKVDEAPDWLSIAGPSKPFTQDKEPRVVKITGVDSITKALLLDNRLA